MKPALLESEEVAKTIKLNFHLTVTLLTEFSMTVIFEVIYKDFLQDRLVFPDQFSSKNINGENNPKQSCLLGDI